MLTRLSRLRRPAAVAATIAAAALGLILASSAPAGAGRAATAKPRAGLTPAVPGIDPGFIYHQLATMATRFQQRESGYLAGASGHARFARYWAAEMIRLLGPFGASARSFPFTIGGWIGRPSTAPALNVEVTVPGVTDPAQVVVVGCHYDGEAISTQSAYDDGSGCAIELGVAEALAKFWRANGLFPRRTLRFVLFDAEEQGVLGSYDYVNHEANGTLREIVAMFNEEASGIGYPLRYLGKAANPLMPTYVYVSPARRNGTYPALDRSPAQAAANRAFTATQKAAVALAFRTFRELGDQELTYRGSDGRPVWQPIFTPADVSHVPVSGDNLGSSDQMPFTMAGIPDAMYLGNYSYYYPSARAGSYPFDQAQDTIGLMDAFADGGTGQSQALTLALGLPGLLTTSMLSQPSVLGSARSGRRPVAAIGSIGQVVPGQPVMLTATGFVPGTRAAELSYSWAFGDGATAFGPAVWHTYAGPGRYVVRLTVSAPHRPPRTVIETLVAGQPATYQNPFTATPGIVPKTTLEGRPTPNRSVVLPAGQPGLSDKVRRIPVIIGRAPEPKRAASAGSVRASSSAGWIVAGIAIVMAAALLVAAIRWRAGRRGVTRNRSAA